MELLKQLLQAEACVERTMGQTLVVHLVAAPAFALFEKTHHASVSKRRMLDVLRARRSSLPVPKAQMALDQSMRGQMETGRIGF